MGIDRPVRDRDHPGMVAASSSRPDFAVLGPLAVCSDGAPVTIARCQVREALCVLLLHVNRAVSTDDLGEYLWPEPHLPPSNWKGQIRTVISRLRRAVGAHMIRSDKSGYRLTVDEHHFDALRFEALVARGDMLNAGGLHAQATTAFLAAEALWRGAAYAEFRLQRDHFAQQAARLEARLLAARIGRFEAALQLGRHRDIEPEVVQLAQHPDALVDERLQAIALVTFYRNGRSAEALCQHERVRVALAARGLVPGPELAGLHQRILHRDADLLRPGLAAGLALGAPIGIDDGAPALPVTVRSAAPVRPSTADTERDRFAAIAGHFRAAWQDHLADARGDAARDLHYSVLAAQHAWNLLAYRDAAGHYEHALAALAVADPYDVPRRCRLLIALGQVRRAAYDRNRARAAFEEAARRALTVDADPLLDSALRELLALHEYGDDQHETACLVDEAHRRPHPTPARRAVLLAARARMTTTDGAEAADQLEEAQRLAADAGDEALTGAVLATAVLVRWAPGTAGWRCQVAEQVRAIGARTADRELEYEGHRLLVAAHLELGDHLAALDHLGSCVALASGAGRPSFDAITAQLEVGFALLHGDFDRAERILESPRTLAAVQEGHNFQAGYVAQLYQLRREQGRLDEILPLLHIVADTGRLPITTVALALSQLELGDRGAGHRHLRDVLAAGLDSFPMDWLWMACMGLLAETTALTGDTTLAGELHRRIAPFADQLVVAAHNVVCLGSAHRYAGVAATVAGRSGDGVSHLRAAVRADEALGAWPALARDHLALGRALIGIGELDHGRAAVRRAMELSTTHNLPGVLRASRRALLDA